MIILQMTPSRPRPVRYIVPLRIGDFESARTEYLNAPGIDRQSARESAVRLAAEVFPGEHATADLPDALIHIGD